MSARDASRDRAPVANDAVAVAGTLSSAPSLSSLGVGEGATAGAALPKVCPACSGRYPADFRVCPRDATPLADAPEDDDPLIGASLGESYEIVRVLGEGGMGKVYEARHRRLPNKRFAIKMLHRELGREPEVVARFQREAEAVSAIEHESVVGVYDVNRTSDGRPYIVQELLEGEDLGKHLERVGRLAPGAAVHVVRQICRALAAAHRRGIVHRDVKPENVFLLGDPSAPTVKMVDFGISKLDEGQSGLTKTGVVMGTPAYMAPEQARGERVDARADIYAVGAILYRALTGRKPYEGLDPMATLTAVLCEDPPRPRSLAPNIPEALELALQRAMAKDPGERWPRIEELDLALAPFDPSASATLLAARAARAADADDKTMLAHEAATLLGAAQAETATKHAKRARPGLVVHSLSILALSLFVLGDAMLGVVRLIGDLSHGPSTGQIVLAAVLAGVLLAAPTVLWARFVVRTVWKNTPRAIEVAERLRRVLVAMIALYALVAIAARVFEGLVRRAPEGIAHPLWSLIGLTLTLLAAVVTWFAIGMADGRRR